MSATVEYTADLIQSLADSSRDRDKWLARGRELADGDSDRRFQIGDWLIAGEEKWSRKAYADAAIIFTNYGKVTLRNLANTARSVQISLRNDVLSWSHHAAVARFAKATDTQKELLAHAVEKGLSVSNFRKYIDKRYPTAKPTRKSDGPVKLVLTVQPDMLAELERVALAMGDEIEGAALFLMQRALQAPDLWERLQSLSEKAS